jgi:hypothetical protein
MFLEVTQAKYLDGYCILSKFNNGVTKIVDLQNELDSKIFEPLKDKQIFKKFAIKPNAIEWYNGADFSPEYLCQIGVQKEIAEKE